MQRGLNGTEFNPVPSRRIDRPSREPPLTDSPLHSSPRPLGGVAVKHRNIDRESAEPVGPQRLQQATRFGGEGGADHDRVPAGVRYVEVALFETDVQSK